MRTRALLLVALLLGAAQGRAADSFRYLQTLAPTNAAALAFTTCVADVATSSAYISIDLAPVRVRFDGTAPTTAIGHLYQPGTSLALQGHTNLLNFKVIATTATPAAVTGSCARP